MLAIGALHCILMKSTKRFLRKIFVEEEERRSEIALCGRACARKQSAVSVVKNRDILSHHQKDFTERFLVKRVRDALCTSARRAVCAFRTAVFDIFVKNRDRSAESTAREKQALEQSVWCCQTLAKCALLRRQPGDLPLSAHHALFGSEKSTSGNQGTALCAAPLFRRTLCSYQRVCFF